MNEEERSNLYILTYSDFDDDYVFAESIYTLDDLHNLQKENKQLKEENQELKKKIKQIIEYAYGTDMLESEYEQLCKIAKENQKNE